MRGLFHDLRYAIRTLVRTPAFAVTAIATLALGIGANVAMFSVVYSVLLKPLPYRAPGTLALVQAEVQYVGANRPVPVMVQSSQLGAWQRTFDGIAATAFYATNVDALSVDGGSEIVNSAIVSGEFFATIAGPLSAGRPLEAADDVQPSAVISRRLAERLFGDAERALGRELPLTHVYTIVGVAAREFQFPNGKVDAWLPAGFVRAGNPRCCGFRVLARLDPAATVERAAAAVQPLFASSVSGKGGTSQVRTSVVRLTDDLLQSVRPALLVLFASVLLVLVIACSNLVNLLLARNAARQREFAVRRALGAPASRLMQQLLAENAVLALAGAACGILLAQPSVVILSRLAGDAVPRMDAIAIDRVALLFAGGLAVAATILSGIVPALRAAASSANPSQESGRTSATRGTRRLQRAMCVVQVTLAAMLLIGATLMGRSLVRLLRVDLGVATDHVLTTSLNLGLGARPTDAETLARIERVIQNVAVLPGVRAVGVGTSLPPSDSRIRITLRRTGDVVDYQAAAVPVTSGYFSALQMRLIRGRLFTDADDDRHPPVMIMSEATARRFFGEGDPVGRTLRMPLLRDGKNTSVDMTLVGVTANVKYAGLAAPPEDIVYRPFAQQPWIAPFLVVRTTGDPVAFTPTLRKAIGATDKAIVTSSFTTLDRLVSDAAAQPQFRTVLSASLAALALGIAAIGLYGVVAYAVSQRAKEIGIRLALGATSRNVLRMILADGLTIAVAGIVIGTAAAFALTRVLADLLYGIAPTDPISFLASAISLLALTLVASYIPARRAARIDPIHALRAE